MSGAGKLTLATVSCPKVACRVKKFSGRITVGTRSAKLKTALPGKIPAGKSRTLEATVPAGLRRAVRSAAPSAMARFSITVVGANKGKLVRPALKVRVR